MLIWHPNDQPLLRAKVLATPAVQTAGVAAGLGAPHSPISARSCSETFTRRGWGGKAEQKSGSAPFHFPRGSEQGWKELRIWRACQSHAQTGVERLPCAPAPSPRGNFCSQRGESWGSHPPGAQRSSPAPSPLWGTTMGPHSLPGCPRSTKGSCVLAARTLLSCLAPSFQALGKLQLCNARARALRNCLHRWQRNQQQQSNVSGKNTVKKASPRKGHDTQRWLWS